MKRSEFVHLHLHSQYSLLESTVRFEPLMNALKAQGAPAVALTDRANLFGAVPFYQIAESHGIKPILGLEVFVAPESRFDKIHNHGLSDAAYHLVLLAESEEGYANLMRLSTAGYLQGFFQVPRVDKEILSRCAKGLIALSGCRNGEIPSFLLKGEKPKAVRAAAQWAEIFGKDRFFLEVQDHGLSEERVVREGLVEVSRETGLPLVAANDVHYLRKEDASAHEVLLCLGKGMVLSDPNHPRYESNEYYLKSPAEMEALFKDIPGAVQRTVEIAERCNLSLEFHKIQLPTFAVPDTAADEAGYLEVLCREGLKKRYGGQTPSGALERMQHELAVIHQTGFSGYFLIVWDIVRDAKNQGIPVGPGRGSAAGSLVAYLLGITDVDPLRWDLLFERFINPERVSAPDIDVDVCDRRRGEVLAHISRTYGVDRVANIITFGTLAARAVVRDVGRVLETPVADIDRIAKWVPAEPKITLEDAAARSPELRALSQSSGPERRLWDTARALEGLVRHTSTHAAGVLIGGHPLVESVPLCNGSGGEVLTQYDMNILKDLGLLKLDVLGLRTLTVLDDACASVAARTGLKVDLDNLPLDDPETFRLLREARTWGVFQLESRGMRDYMRKLSPDRFEDLIALLALYRPGPLGSDMVDDFIRRKKGQIPVVYPHPLCEPILKPTYGVILYQEQVMRLASVLGGFTLGQADLLRRAMGNKNPEVMEKQRGRFLIGAKERGIPNATAESLFNLMAKFAGYGFNKSHSTAYALVAYRSAYMKARYPADFMAALMTSERGDTDKLAEYVSECRRMELAMLPPDVNVGTANFTVEGDRSVRYGLLALRGVGYPAVESLVEARKTGGPYKDLFDFCRRVDLRAFTPKMVESLVLSGAFDATGAKRSQMKDALEKAFQDAHVSQNERETGQAALFGGAEKPSFAEMPEMRSAELLQGEKESLGFFLSGHPLTEHQWELEHYVTPLDEIAALNDGAEIRVGGMVAALTVGQVKKTKETYARFVLEDLRQHLEVLVWPEAYRNCSPLLERGRLVALKGRVDRSSEKVQVVASEVIRLEDMASRWAKSVRLKVNAVGFDDGILKKVGAVCAKYPGHAQVKFQLQTSHQGEVLIEAGEQLKVEPKLEFLRETTELLGEDSIDVEV
jgi:DNA polymerase-3 subunit alpha